MSKELGLSLLRPDYSDSRIPVMEHPNGLSRAAIKHFSGIDPLLEPNRIPEAWRCIAEAFEIDLLWGGGFPGPESETFDWDDGESVKINRSGQKVVQWGVFYTVVQEDGRHFLDWKKPESPEEALKTQPLDICPTSTDEYEALFRAQYKDMVASTGETCQPIPHHYTTCFHFPLAVFGFEMLCEMGLHEDAFDALMEQFVEISVRIATAWSRVPDLKAFILHDDLTTSAGPIFRPQWYRRHIFPHYPRIFAPFLNAGIPLIFTSDGNCSAFADDIFDAGADGLNFEYLVDLERLVANHPDKILIGNVNSATIAQGPLDRIEEETRRCISIGSKARRFVMNVGGGLTHDMPVGNLEAYLKLRKELCRTQR